MIVSCQVDSHTEASPAEVSENVSATKSGTIRSVEDTTTAEESTSAEETTTVEETTTAPEPMLGPEGRNHLKRGPLV